MLSIPAAAEGDSNPSDGWDTEWTRISSCFTNAELLKASCRGLIQINWIQMINTESYKQQEHKVNKAV